jgi:hypothetical protein
MVLLGLIGTSEEFIPKKGTEDGEIMPLPQDM